jgi:hypothetical protein
MTCHPVCTGRESLAARAGRKRDLRDHLRPHQRPAAQDSAVESSGGGVAWCSLDGRNRCSDARAGLSGGQLTR